MPNEQAILKKLRALCLALPDASETVTFGHPTFQAGKKTFCVFEEYKGELCIVFKAELPQQQALIQSPRFFTAPYIGKHGWVSLRAESKLDWGEIRDLVTTSHRLVAQPNAEKVRSKGSKPSNSSASSKASTASKASRRTSKATSSKKSNRRPE